MCAGRAAGSGRVRARLRAAAFATLFECLETLTLLMAPIVPFITDHVWQALRRPDAPESVHLASWPKADESLINPALSEQMALVRRLVELGRAARVDSGQRVRQPLARALVGAPGFAELPEQLRAQIAEELNVVQLDPLSVVGGDLVDYSVKPNFRALGKRFGKTTPRVAQAIREADAKTLVERLRADNAATVDVDGEQVVLSADEVVVTEQPREGWTVASEAGETVALDLELTPGAAPGRCRPRGDPSGAGCAQVQRVEHLRPYPPVVVGDRRDDSAGHG